ncbi:MAG: hypothetical protein VX405_02020, partial [Myxococcota bacterium]|nr:hypothetical protein [Myxococcota bacterium]
VAAAIWRRYESQQEDCLAFAEGEAAELACRKIPQQWRGFARIMHVEPVQFDEDAEQELLVCGDDAFGGWIAVIDPNMDRARRGANPLGEGPLQALPTYTAPAPLGEAVAWVEAKRFMLPPADSTRYCQVVEQAMGRNWILSPGLPGSDRNPVPELVLTPLEGLRLGAPQVLALRGLRPEAYTQLAWARWEEEEGAVAGPVVNQGQSYGFIASVGPEGGAQLSSARPVNVDMTRRYPAIAFDGDGDRWSESCSTPNTGLSHCSTQRPAEEGWQGGEATVAEWPGTLAAQVEWGERTGLIAFQRHANRLAWYDLRRRLAPCSPSVEGPGCPEPICGDGELQREEICEPGAGCSDECTLAELPAGAPAAGLAIPFAPATFATNQGEVRFLQGLTVNPVVTFPINTAGRTSGAQTNLNEGNWYRDRSLCRRWGGDLPSDRQYEWIATGGAGPLARRYPWGDSPPQPASAMYSGGDLRSSRAGSHWLGTSVEGLADLAGTFERYGHWVLDDTGRSAPSGIAPQRGPQASQNENPPKKGGSKSQGIEYLPSGARYSSNNRSFHSVYGVGRCVWSVFSP